MALGDAAVGLLRGKELARGFFDAAHGRLVAGEDTEVVLLAQAVEELLHLLGRDLRVRADDEQHAASAHAVGDLFQPRQRQHVIVAGLARRLEHLAQAVPDQIVDLILRRVVGQALQELGQVLLAVEIVATFGRVMQIPGDLLQLLEGGQELGRLAQRRDEALDHFLAREALHGIDRGGEAGGEQQRADLGGGFLAGLQVDDLGVSRGCASQRSFAITSRMPEISVSLSRTSGMDEVEVLRADEEDVIGLALPDGLEQTGDQLDQAARLLELLVFLEQGDDVLQARMERVGGGDLVGDGLGPAAGRLGLGGFFQLPAEGVGDVLDLGLVGQRREEALAQDVVDLVRGEIHRRDVAFLAAELGARVFEGAVDEPRAGVIGRGEVGDDDADILLLAGGREQVGEGARGDVGDRAVAYLLRVEVVEVGRHLVEQDEDGLARRRTASASPFRPEPWGRSSRTL